MHPTTARTCLLAPLLAVLCLHNAPAQQPETPDATTPADADITPEASPAEPPEPLPGPQFFNLRYDEDFSYLDGQPGTYQLDFFDPIKNIHLAEDLRLSIGGEFRFRMESETNKHFGAAVPTQDNLQLYRVFTHFDLKYRKTARVFLQLESALVGDRELAPRAIDENRFAVQQLFVDLRPLGDATPLTLRMGRQDLQYGAQRLVSPLDWANTRRRFDGVKLFWTADDWRFDVFWGRPVIVRAERPDRCDDDVDFYGAYLTWTGLPDHGVDVFFFGQHDIRDRVNPNGQAGDMSRYTFGGRFWGKRAGFDYETLLAGQWGKWAGDAIHAWAWTVEGGYTFADCPWRPRIGAGFDLATGDHDPADNSVGTFDQLYPLGHKYLGYIDLIGRQNVNAANVNLSAWPVAKKLRTELTYYTFWLNAKEDALYGVGGAPGLRDLTGDSGREVGHELDLTLLWKVDIHSAVLLGWSHFWTSDFIRNTGPDDDADLFYVQYSYKF